MRAIGNGAGCLPALAVLAAVLASGCAPSLPSAGTQFDGTYTGLDSLVSGTPYQCGAPAYPETIEVRGGRFEYPFVVNWPRTAPMDVQVFADGTTHGQAQYGTDGYSRWRQDFMTSWVTVDGRISDATLEATMADLRCVRHLTARRG
jgi:hypothetical protein